MNEKMHETEKEKDDGDNIARRSHNTKNQKNKSLKEINRFPNYPGDYLTIFERSTHSHHPSARQVPRTIDSILIDRCKGVKDCHHHHNILITDTQIGISWNCF